MSKSNRIYITILFLFSSFLLKADIKYVAKVCKDDVAGFVYIPINGKTVSNIYWEFGDGFTSNNTNAIHIYTIKGTYKVKGVVTFTDATTLTETVDIEIMGVPTANFVFENFKDSCTNNNRICLKDLSTPDNINQGISQKIITWGDGNSYRTYSPYSGEVNCNNYYSADKFKIFVEITDNVGCKSTFKRYVTIKEGINVNLSASIDYTDCKTANVCIKNLSSTASKLKPTYKWTIDSLASDTNSYLITQKCINYKASKRFTISLTGTLPNGCSETSIRDIEIFLGDLKKDIVLSDSAICYGSGKREISAKIDKKGITDINWYLDNKILNDHSDSVIFTTDDSAMLPGYHTISCLLFRGNCSTLVKKTVHILGPVASFEVFNFNGCIIPEKRTFFINQSTYNPLFTTFNWKIEDEFGDNCTTNRGKNINKSDYCNMAEDSFAIHRFRETLNQTIVTFKITDSKTGCYDVESKLILNKCCKLCQPGPPRDINLCLGDLIFEELSDVKLPYKITFNNGLKWYKYPVTSDSIGVGTYKMQIIFKNEYKRWLDYFDDDSFVIKSGLKVFYDTLNVLNKLIIHDNRRDSIGIKIYGKCSPFRASLFYKNTQFNVGESIVINWGDGTYDNIKITNSQTIDSFEHLYTLPGLGFYVTAKITNAAGCESEAKAFVSFGKRIEILVDKVFCAKTNVCITPNIFETKNNTTWTENKNGKQIIWWSTNAPKKDTGFKHCEYFEKGGNHNITLQINDSDGCTETITKTIFIKEIKAGIKKHLRDVYCTELTQFFDSSTLIGDSSDYITSYLWDYGTKQFSVTDKNPSKAFDLPADSLRITHVVVSNSGCTDTTTTSLKFIGANTYFTIKDTIACTTLDGVFYNLSTNGSKYIWEFGNDSNSTFNTDTKETAYKTYRKVGKYKIRLRGIQSVYNPFTNNLYFCNSIFPDPDYDKDTSRTVWVLPDYKSAILSRDTICLNDSIEFKSALDSIYKVNYWSIDDSSFKISNSPYTFKHQFNKEGLFNIKLKPEITNTNKLLGCVDSAIKKVYVVKVRAGFTIDDNYVPNIQFTNTSTPKFANYAWNFGDDNSLNNTSSEENPGHTYVDLTKEYTVCLIASLKFGCADTICKPIGPYNTYCSVYNVFTPGNKDGNKDGYNDLYDIVIEGESYYNLYIYDRWGVLVYKGEKDNDDSQNNNWNGRVFNTGPECSGGTYYYVFNYTMKVKPEDKKTLSGVITLIR